MESSLTESVQQLVRPGKCVDLYYPDPETAQKACFRTTVNTKYRQAFTNLTQGTNVFTIPPNNGIQDIVCNLVLPAITGTGFGGIALPPGWGYSAIKQISWRYGGLTQWVM